MTKLRLVLLATTAVTAMPLANSGSHAQTAPIVVAQQGEVGPDGKPKPPPRGAPPRPAPPAAAPPPRAAPPAPPRPAAP
ncbi:MAG TPA: OmpA family protein, partial [Bradyrhizobium sp.]